MPSRNTLRHFLALPNALTGGRSQVPNDPTLSRYYRKLRSEKELSHEDAIRDSVVSVLMSPDFLYRLDLSSSAETPSNSRLRPVALKTALPKNSEPLSSYSLASRLSYFLWSSMPDDRIVAACCR